MTTARFASLFTIAALLLFASPAVRPADAGQTKALKCAFAKQRAAVKVADSLLDCDRVALTTGSPISPACEDAAVARLRDRFSKIELKGGCTPNGDVGFVEQVVGRAVELLERQLQGACSLPGEQCTATNPPCCSGLCRAVIGQPGFCQ